MKRIILTIAISLSVLSCKDIGNSTQKGDFPNDSLGKIVGNDKDDKGCVASAGYQWSDLKNACVRPFEVGIRLNPIAEIKAGDAVLSAFALLEEDGNKAEIFLPDHPNSILLERESNQKPYVKDDWTLLTLKGFTLKKGDSIIYAGAVVNEHVVTGSDKIDE